MTNGIPADEVVRMLTQASSEQPNAYVGELEAGSIMRVYDGPEGREIGRIEFGKPSRIIWFDESS